MQYTLRFTPGDGRARTLDLQLCTTCLNEFRTAPDVEVVENRHLGQVNPSGR